MAVSFDSLVSRETIASFGVDMTFWGEEEQSLLREGMILAMKENPEWTEEQVKKACEEQVDDILFNAFQEHLGYLVEKTHHWASLEDAYCEFRTTPLKKFLKVVTEQQEFQDFADAFYDELREMYNICSAGMWDEFQRMKKNGWSLSQYRTWLKKETKKRR